MLHTNFTVSENLQKPSVSKILADTTVTTLAILADTTVAILLVFLSQIAFVNFHLQCI